MKNIKFVIVVLLLIIIGVLISVFKPAKVDISKNISTIKKDVAAIITDPLAVEIMRKKTYPGSKITIEQTLTDGVNYHQYIASYQSDGLKIYALLTVPFGTKPANGWPVILFNHGYITPSQYKTTERYVAYVDAFARNGYIVFKPDFRGHGNSEGQPEGAYYAPAYTIDDLNALTSIKNYKDSNPAKIGVWGHSMGGNITMRDLVINTKDIKAAVIWGGVVGTYAELATWHDPNYHPSVYELTLRYLHKSELQKKYGTVQSNPTFWNAVDPNFFLKDIATPVQIDVGGADQEVPISFSQGFFERLKAAGKAVEFYEYPGSNHDIQQGFNLAMQRSIAFFDRYLK